MKVKISQQDLFDVLGRVQSLSERKTTMPIIGNVLLKVKGDDLFLTATNMEVGAMVKIPAQVIEAGEVAVPSKDFYEIVREIHPSSAIEMETLPGHSLYIKAGHAEFRLAGPDPREFPALPERTEGVHFVVSGLALSRMIGKVAFAMSRDETRYHLNGIFFDGHADGVLKLVATDGHRLSYVENQVAFPEDYHAVVPRRGAVEVERFCNRVGEGEVHIYLGKKSLDVIDDTWRLTTRLVDGEFPRYEQIIPAEYDREINVNRALLMAALRRVCILVSERSNGIRVSFSTGHLEMGTQNSEKGEGKEELECDYRGEFFQVGFNARYFLDVLGVTEGDVVTLTMKGTLSPCVIKSSLDPGWFAVLMPMRI